jgi:putative transposase
MSAKDAEMRRSASAAATMMYQPTSFQKRASTREDSQELALMRRIDEMHLELPCAGSRLLRDLLRNEPVVIRREHVRTLMRRLGITAIYQLLETTRRHRAHPVLP